MRAKDWLNKNNWSEGYVESDIFPHHTMLSDIMEQYAKEYMSQNLKKIVSQTESKLKSFL